MNGRQFGAPESRPVPERPPVPPRPVNYSDDVVSTTSTLTHSAEAASLRDALASERVTTARHDRRTPRAARSARTAGHRWLWPFVGVAAVVVLIIAWLIVGHLFGSGLAGVDRSGYQAVFLTNGQTYFGKLQAENSDYLELSDVFYLNSTTPMSTTSGDATTDNTATDANNLQLFKMTDASVIGPDDAMYIATKQVLLYENLKPNSKVAQAIAKYQQSHA